MRRHTVDTNLSYIVSDAFDGVPNINMFVEYVIDTPYSDFIILADGL